MAKDVHGLIHEAATVLSEAMDEAAALAVLAVEKYGAQLQAFCKQVAEEAGMPEAWNALRHRAQDMQKAKTKGLSSRRTAATEDRYVRAVRHMAREPKAALALPHGDKVELARSLLSDSEVAEDVVRDDRTRRQASKAVEKVAQETVRESEARDRQRYPQETADRDVLAVVSFINDADERVKAALRVIRGGLQVTAELRPALLDAIERLENTTGWLRTVVESKHRTTDDALDEILRGER